MYLEYIETTAEDFMGHCYWDEALKEKVREPVIANGHQCFDLEQTRRMIDFAWFEYPHRPVTISMWDEATKRKMRQPVLGNGCHHLSDESLRILVEFGWSAPLHRAKDDCVEGSLVELALNEPKRRVDEAIAFCKASGKGIALAEFSNPHGRFAEGEHYVYVLDTSGMMLAHPVSEDFVGKDFYRVQDTEGKSFVKKIVDTADNGGSGWVEYKWFKPATKREPLKMVYFEKFDNLIFCSGVYQS